VGDTLWRYADVAGHWDQLQMRSWRERAGVPALYETVP
jgi:hypothetical protein